MKGKDSEKRKYREISFGLRRDRRPSERRQIHDDERDGRRKGRHRFQPSADDTQPVSYTHLDVYKRQWVDYSMIDDEFVYATVVLVFEAPIGARHGAD